MRFLHRYRWLAVYLKGKEFVEDCCQQGQLCFILIDAANDSPQMGRGYTHNIEVP